MYLRRLRTMHLSVVPCLSLLAVSSLLTGCTNMVPTAPSAPIKTAIGGLQGHVHGGRGPVVGANLYLYSPSLTGYGGSGIAASSLNASTPLLTSAVPSTCGVGATATATADPVTGAITSITVTASGAGYFVNGVATPPIVTISDSNGGNGHGASATVNLGLTPNGPGGGSGPPGSGWVQSISISNAGSSYTAPVVTITPASTSPCQDANGNYYVNTDTNGNFNITGDYTCTAGLPVYIYTTGGDTGGGGASVDDGFMAVAGICPASGTLATLVPYVNVNELTTVATAYSVAGFATDPKHIGVLLQKTAPAASSLASLNALEMTGLTNAFNTAGNLYNIAVQASSSPTTTPNGNGVLPYQELNTLGDILANCVNSTYINYACQTLLSYTPGQTDTAGAAIYIAQNPAANVANIFALATANGSPWQPMLTTAPNDWTVSIVYSGGGLKKATYSGEGYTVAIDASGTIWHSNYADKKPTVSKLSPLGVPEGPTSTTGYAVGAGDSAAAVDINGNVWTANTDDNTLSKIVPTGTNTANISTVTVTGTQAPTVLEFDGSGNMYIADAYDYIFKANSAGAYIKKSSYSQAGVNFPASLAVSPGANGNVWVGNENDNIVDSFSSTFATKVEFALPNQSSYTSAIAIDANGNAWAAALPTSGAGSLQKVTPAGVGTTFNAEADDFPSWYDSVYVDGGNNVWATDLSNGVITEINATTGTPLSGTLGFAAPGNIPCNTGCANITVGPQALQVDQSGNVWYDLTTAGSLIEIVGVASPTVQPLSYAAANSLYGVKP